MGEEDGVCKEAPYHSLQYRAVTEAGAGSGHG